ncbi:MAG: cation-translocating P-type ATPase [bacterium]
MGSDPPYYSLSVEATAHHFNTDLHQGLTSEAARRRLEIHGPNRIPGGGLRSPGRIFLDQILNPMILLLLAVIGVSLAIGHGTDALIIAWIVALNAGIGFFQEYRAERAMESLRRLAVPSAQVLREGRLVRVPAEALVPGDIVHLEAGDRIPADLRFSEIVGLRVDESLLTGESVTVAKELRALREADLSLGDQSNMGFMGTHAVGGRGRGICVATGSETELGRIAQLVARERPGEIPLQKRMNQLTRRLVWTAFGLCLLIFLVGLLQAKPWVEMLLTAVSLGVAAIPESLPAVITISLSLGALRLARRGVLVRNLQAVEALGAITAICADKTGTLTVNQMEVRAGYFQGQRFEAPFPSGPNPREALGLFRALALCNDAGTAPAETRPAGDPMEVALLKFVAAMGLDPAALREEFPRVAEVPFDADRKCMTTLHRHAGERIAFTKGAPEALLRICVQEWTEGEARPISAARARELEAIQEGMAAEGYRVLAVAMKKVAPEEEASLAERDMVLLGLVGLQDPPRAEARPAIADCRSAGIQPVMMTGDHPATAVAIGRELGLFREGDSVITGTDLKREGRDWLDAQAERASIYARVSPEDKLRIIEVLQDNRNFVAMTGDGVNDAPALKKADVGIAMGRGTDVAKEASDLILTEENFTAIVRAVREGRIVYDNIRKFVRYMLTTNLGEIATMLFAMALALPLPVLPLQILWINLVTDGLPAVALGFEPAEEDVMGRPPRDTRENILGRGLWEHTLAVGCFMGLLSVGALYFFWRRDHDLQLAQTVTFTTLVFTQMGHVMGVRSERHALWRIGIFSNYRLAGAVLVTVISQILILYLPPLQRLFHVVPLRAAELLLCMALGLLLYASVEAEKFWRFRR